MHTEHDDVDSTYLAILQSSALAYITRCKTKTKKLSIFKAALYFHIEHDVVDRTYLATNSPI